MAKLHLLAHNNKNFLKEGDIVEQYKTKIGTIGTGNGSYWAHLHHSLSEGLSVPELRRYINGWSKSKVEKYYSKPTPDYNKMFGRVMDVGNRGYGWLQVISNGSYHPGLDINGLGGGNTDIGYEYTSPCNGKVVYVNNTTQKDGWGKMTVIEEINIKEEPMNKKLQKAIEEITRDSYGDKFTDEEQKKAGEDLLKFKDEYKDFETKSLTKIDDLQKLLNLQTESRDRDIEQFQRDIKGKNAEIDKLQKKYDKINNANTILAETVEQFEKEQGKTLTSFKILGYPIIIKEKQ